MKRLHVTGCRRSGTTLLFEMLATCFEHDDHCEHEQSIFVPIDEVKGQLYFSKKPSDITHVHKIFAQDPELFLIYVRRDPRAVITSIHPSKADVYYSSFERWQRYEDAAGPLLSHPRCLLVKYEELVRSPNAVQENIEAQFSFLNRRHDFSEFHLHARSSAKAQISLKGLRPISADSLDSWQAHLPRIKFQVERYPELTQTIKDYSYEPDDSWLEMLDDISTRSQTYGEQRPNWLKRQETNLRYALKTRAYLSRRS